MTQTHPDRASPAAGTQLEVEVLGDKRKATVATMPLYDPKNERMKS